LDLRGLGGLDLGLEFKAEGLQIWVWIFGIWIFGVRGYRVCGKDISANPGVCTFQGRKYRDLTLGVGAVPLSRTPFLDIIIPSQSKASPGPLQPSLPWLGLVICLCLAQHLSVHL
jgi:hypothetical protein